MTIPFRQRQRTPFEKVMLHLCCDTYELAKALFKKPDSEHFDRIDAWIEGRLTPPPDMQEKISVYLNVPKYELWPWVWDFSDLETRLDSLREMLLKTTYKDKAFNVICEQMAAVELKIFIRNRKERNCKNGDDPYILPQCIGNPYLSC